MLDHTRPIGDPILRIEQQVVSLGLCKELMAAGAPTNTFWAWEYSNGRWYVHAAAWHMYGISDSVIPAYSYGEILQLIPHGPEYNLTVVSDDAWYSCGIAVDAIRIGELDPPENDSYFGKAEKLVDALGLTLIEAIKKGYVELPEVGDE